MAEEHVVQEKALRSFCEEVLTKLGVPKADAQTVTDVLVVADLRGIESNGVARLGRYVTGLKKGFMKPTDQSRIVKETKATALMDGGQSLGQVVGKRGMDLAIRKARDTAIGVVAVRNSNHYGIAGYYTLMALEHDLMGVSMTNAGPLVVQTFGRTAILGTNTFSLAATGLQVYSDEQRPNVGHFFMALDPAAFRPLDEFRRDMDRLARELKDSPKAHGQDRIYVHGEKSFARMEKYRQEGIPLDPKVVENLKKIGADLGVPWSV